MKTNRASIILILLLLAFASLDAQEPPPPATINTMLAWTGSPEADVSGYRIYWGTAKDVWPNQLDVGANLTGTITTPVGGYVFVVVTAYTADGLESGPSNQVVFQSQPAGQQKAPTAPGQLHIVKPVAISIEESFDLQGPWSTIFKRVAAASIANQAFYRLVLEESPPTL